MAVCVCVCVGAHYNMRGADMQMRLVDLKTASC